MNDMKSRNQSDALKLYLSAPHPCSYFPDRTAQTLFADPSLLMTTRIYGHFADRGFRRSGCYVYRPHCPDCNACIPARIPVADFAPTRSQRRTWARNQDLQVEPTGVMTPEQLALYQRYLEHRHPGSIMNEPETSHPLETLAGRWSDTRFYEFRSPEALLAVAVVDHLPGALSAVYTFFEPEMPQRGLGVYAVLWEIEHARRLGHDHLYLGYWIRDCRKMAYKTQYRPLDIYVDGHWERAASDKE